MRGDDLLHGIVITSDIYNCTYFHLNCHAPHSNIQVNANHLAVRANDAEPVSSLRRVLPNVKTVA